MDLITPATSPVSTLASDVVTWVDPLATLTEVAETLSRAEVSLVVVRDTRDTGRPAGVITERDMVHAVAEGRDPAATHASEICHTEIAWADAEATVAEVAEEMMERYIRHVLVEKDGELLGVVSARDLLGAYAAPDALED
jgi:CBS domain-containing protein